MTDNLLSVSANSQARMSDSSTSREENRNGVALTSLRSWFKPEQCPITGRPFFMWIEHHEKGWVPTYGGPYDSYTLAERDEEGSFVCERYDHDAGGWLLDQVEGIGMRLIDDQREDYEYGTLQAAESRHKAEMAALVEDAKRYRYLRDHWSTGDHVGGGDIGVEISFTSEIHHTVCGEWPSAIDKAVDAAILALLPQEVEG